MRNRRSTSVSNHRGNSWLSYTHSAQQDETTIATHLPNDEALRETERRPTRKHHEIGYAGEMAGERDKGISKLQTCEDAKGLAYSEAAAQQYVMKMIAARRKRRFPTQRTAHEAGQAVKDRS